MREEEELRREQEEEEERQREMKLEEQRKHAESEYQRWKTGFVKVVEQRESIWTPEIEDEIADAIV